jgi:hypothetical protein
MCTARFRIYDIALFSANILSSLIFSLSGGKNWGNIFLHEGSGCCHADNRAVQ